MASFRQMKALCTTQLKNFTEIQGIGSDPMYMRYDSVNNIVRKYLPNHAGFLARPEYFVEDDAITWYASEWTDTPVRLTELQGAERQKYEQIKKTTMGDFADLLQKLRGEANTILGNALKGMQDDFLFCYDNNIVLVAWGMRFSGDSYAAKGSITYNYSFVKDYTVVFDPGEGAELVNENERIIHRKENAEIQTADLPKLKVKDGYIFLGWVPKPQGIIVKSNLIFHATFRKDEAAPTPVVPIVPIEEEPIAPPPSPPIEVPQFSVVFDGGAHGRVNGSNTLMLKQGSTISPYMVPSVLADESYVFRCWSPDPLRSVVNSDLYFTACYDRVPWWRRFWIWLSSFDCLKWLLALLLLLLLLWVLSFLLRGCGHRDHVLWGGDDDPDGTYQKYYIPSVPTYQLTPRRHDGQIMCDSDGQVIYDTIVVNDQGSDDGNTPQTDISDGVKQAGGDINAYMRFSIMWNQSGHDHVDLDAHAIQPDRKEISFQNGLRVPSSMGGQLDVDAIRPAAAGVENIVWADPTKLRDGHYKLFIRNYDGGRNNGAKAEVAFNGHTWEYNVPHEIRQGHDAQIADIIIGNNGRSCRVVQSPYLVRH